MFGKNCFAQVICMLVCVLFLTSSQSHGVETRGDKLTPSQMRHAELVKKANKVVDQRAPAVAKDPLRPIFHIMTPAHWCNDPHGIIFFEGRYHLFLQCDIYFSDDEESVGRGWGHLSSKDFVHWEHEPIALVPGPEEYDKDGIWSGGSFIDNDGIPTIIYSSRPHGGQAMAKSYDGMKTWVKYENNPVITQRDLPSETRIWMRDPTFFKAGETINLLIGAPWYGKKGIKGTVLLYQSTDSVHWKYRHQICEGYGTMWECANMLPVSRGKHVLFVSDNPGEWLDRVVKYSVGTWKNEQFEMGPWSYFDWGERVPYAPGGFVDEKGRAIALGYIPARGLASSPPWANCLSLPRVLKARDDGLLSMEPLPELETLRGKKYEFDPVTINDDSPNILEDIKLNTFEIAVELENINAERFGFELLRSDDGKKSAPVVYNTLTKEFTVGDTTGPFMLLTEEKTMKLHIFVDRTVLEMFAGGREVFTADSATDDPDNHGMRLFAIGGSVKVKSIAVWEIRTPDL